MNARPGSWRRRLASKPWTRGRHRGPRGRGRVELRLHERLPRHRQRHGDDDRHRRAPAAHRGDDRDVVVTGADPAQRLERALAELRVEPQRAVVAGADPAELEAARAAGVELAIGVARGEASPETLRRAGAVTVVADLQELLAPGIG